MSRIAGDRCLGLSRKFNILSEWQTKVVDRLVRQNDRQILFVVDVKGGMGKSFLTKHLLGINPDTTWACQGGKLTDLMHAFASGADRIETAIFDMARCNNPDWFPWSFMENLKNGWFTSTKYNGRFQPVHEEIKIVVFMNEDPPRNKLSSDRYDVMFISK